MSKKSSTFAGSLDKEGEEEPKAYFLYAPFFPNNINQTSREDLIYLRPTHQTIINNPNNHGKEP